MKLLVLMVLLSIVNCSLFAQIQKCQNIFVWDFSDDNGVKNDFTKDLSSVAEEALVNVSDCKILQRRNIGTLNAVISNESAIQSVKEMKDNIIKNLDTYGAERVLFGELIKLSQKEYQLRLHIENLKTTEILGEKSALITISDMLDFDKKRIIVTKVVYDLLGKKYTEPVADAVNPSNKSSSPSDGNGDEAASATADATIQNIDNGIDFAVISCVGNPSSQTVTINFAFSNSSKPNQKILIAPSLYKIGESTAFDNDGNQFGFKSVALGNNTSTMALTTELYTNLTLKGSITYSNVVPKTTTIFAKIVVRTQNWDGGADRKEGVIQINNLKIKWEKLQAVKDAAKSLYDKAKQIKLF